MLETRATADGALRAAISLAGRRGARHGWVTLVARDGTEAAAYAQPQPPLELPSEEQRAMDAAGDGHREIDPVAQRQATGGAMFVF